LKLENIYENKSTKEEKKSNENKLNLYLSKALQFKPRNSTTSTKKIKTDLEQFYFDNDDDKEEEEIDDDVLSRKGKSGRYSRKQDSESSVWSESKSIEESSPELGTL